jgi:hypothetical protein|tara:strand:+ start:252 stop:572 length:321 start_codon:yes stop_codon:yes gene_type:complete
MKNLIIILFMLFGFSASAQDVTVIHFNYKWNDRNNYNIRGLKNAKLQYAWLEEQPESVKRTIKAVPVVVILKNGKVRGQFAADISFEIHATRDEIQDFINKVAEDK